MERPLPLPLDEAFALVADIGSHGRWIPLTRVQVSGPLEPGTRVSALTAGVFRDRMVVTDVVRPRLLKVRKVGPLLQGSVTIAVTPLGPERSLVQWVYDVHAAGPVPRRLSRAVLTPALDAMAGLVLRRMARALGPRRPGAAAPPEAG